MLVAATDPFLDVVVVEVAVVAGFPPPRPPSADSSVVCEETTLVDVVFAGRLVVIWD